MNLSDLAKSYVRTVVPIIVGLVISLGLRAGVNLHGYAPEITAAVTALYYGLARLLEAKLSPAFGWLLGYASPPKYAPATPAPAKTAGFADVLYLALTALVIVVILLLLHVI